MLESLGVMNAGLYALGAAALILCPGPNSIFVFKTSIQKGARAAFRAACAVFLGDAALIFLSYLGVAAALEAHPLLFTAVRIAGAAYLAYLGASTLVATYRRRKADKKDEPGKPLPDAGSSPFRTALILSLTNPKAIIFYVAFFSQFINPSYAHPWVSYLVMAAILEAFSFVWMTTLCFAGVAIQRFVGSRPLFAKIGNTALGALFLGFAGKLAAI
ncbi:MAG: leucine efflux protein LeuE [Sutterellaceae bacterium]|nr:leucine efflux protein LeuE [Sutterellaceae bacterium]MDD7441381.1 leucine efflux protein LeuE [Sutterellaceae bacterium]MDY2867483.1 leucine efflux protein LeuE [Mesosutterella sp.]